MASRKVVGLVLALVLVVSLASAAPARLIALLAPADRVIMQGFGGTLWHGSASRVLVQAGPGYLHLGAVEWALRPLSLLTFRPRLDLRSRWGRQQVSGELVLRGDNEFSLHDLSANLSAELVRHYLPVVLEGDLSFQFATLHLREGLPYHTDGRLVWQGAAWLSPAGIRPLGSYAVELQQSAGEVLAGQVVTLSGPVDATGSLQLSGGDYRVDILVGSAESLDNQLRQALSLVASPEGERYRVNLEGQL
jgi:general secretion pathway protein N